MPCLATIAKNLERGHRLYYSVERIKAGNTTATYDDVYAVMVSHIEGDRVVASWNGNPKQTFYVQTYNKWRVNRPDPSKLKKNPFHMRG